ncbi:MAG: ABC transporter permease [Thermofilaceae archaeon]
MAGSRARRGTQTLKVLLHYRSFVIGLVILAFFIGLTIYAAVTWPYQQAISAWNNPEAWREYPEGVPPAWIQLLTGRKEIEGSLIYDTRSISPRFITRTRYTSGGVTLEQVEVVIPFDYDVVPTGVVMSLIPVIAEVENVTRSIGIRKVVWVKPNGFNMTIFSGTISIGEEYPLPIRPSPGEESRVLVEYRRAIRRIYNVTIEGINLTYIQALFADDDYLVERGEFRVLKGNYKLVYDYSLAPGIESVELKAIFKGTVFGPAGTDTIGRDLFMGIAWGTPYALSFGLLAALLSTMLTMVIAAFAAWYRSVVDVTISRVNEIFMILPFLPTIIMIMLFYGFTLWTLLGVVILFSVLGGGGLKSQRALFLQLREMPYIEAARAYGAGNFRIIFRYLVPRVLPMLIPSIVTSVPSFVFLEAALAILGISDPLAITWGKILDQAYAKAALIGGMWHWIFAPSAALFLLSIAFASIGFTLDRVFNPRLRQL